MTVIRFPPKSICSGIVQLILKSLWKGEIWNFARYFRKFPMIKTKLIIEAIKWSWRMKFADFLFRRFFNFLFEILNFSNFRRLWIVKFQQGDFGHEEKSQNGLDVEMSCPFPVSFNRLNRF